MTKLYVSQNLKLVVLTLIASAGLAKGSTGQSLDSLLEQAKAQKLTYLPQYIAGRSQDCEGFGVLKESCLQELLIHAQEVVSCRGSLKRFNEGLEYDKRISKETFLQNPLIPVPKNVQRHYEKLKKVALKELKSIFPIEFSLQAYDSKLPNAHAALKGDLFISSGFWNKEPVFTDEEMAAILAHEFTHVLEEHSMILNCMALEWVGTERDVNFAQATFIEDIRGSQRQEVWSSLSQKLEYDADKGATVLLKKAGYDPNLMAQALKKLKPPSSGFSSGSHPEFDVRIEAALEAARNQK